MNGLTQFTVKRGHDGFGSQMLATLIGYLLSVQNNIKFYYSPIECIKLCYVGEQNKEIKQLNAAIDSMMANLNISQAKSDIPVIIKPYHLCNASTLKGVGLTNLKKCWKEPSPKKDRKTLSIHIRMGDDVEVDNRVRCQPISYYNSLIRRCLQAFPTYDIQVISWRQPNIDLDLKSKITMYSSTDGGDIADHYNLMIHSDLLIVASSSFSISAGLLNKGHVLCDKNIIGISAPYPKEWNDNFRSVLG